MVENDTSTLIHEVLGLLQYRVTKDAIEPAWGKNTFTHVIARRLLESKKKTTPHFKFSM
ncbi:hypothetical protein V6N11_084208 [Hibiscus sabdariffa]|uniref:Uncharacterized protein n=1 Tax=Hibiscus sabdariffa TaxID=183260 RepID=A0ABR2QS91_9ROSI